MKKAMRAEALARRDTLSIETRIEKSLAMVDHGAGIDVPPGAVVSGFWPIRSEADIRPLLSALRERGARICLPVVLDKETILFRELVRGAELVKTGFGTTGPGEEAAVLEPDIMLVPLAAVDERGHRIGYGAGHYDRAISKLHDMGREPRLIGVAFDCQRVELVPEQPHDVALDAVLTESGLREFVPAA